MGTAAADVDALGDWLVLKEARGREAGRAWRAQARAAGAATLLRGAIVCAEGEGDVGGGDWRKESDNDNDSGSELSFGREVKSSFYSACKG